MKIELFEAILHTGGETAEQFRAEEPDATDDEIQCYIKIFDAMDGQRAIVAPSFFGPNEYKYGGLLDEAQGKEVAYLNLTHEIYRPHIAISQIGSSILETSIVIGIS